MKKNNLPSKINSSTSMNFKWDDFTYKKKDFKAYRSYLSKKIVILNHTDTVFLKNPDGSVDFSKKMNFDDLKLDLIDNGFKISDNNFKSIINSGSIEKIDSLIIFFNQLKTNKWDKVDRIKDLVSAAKLKGEFDENLKLIKKWLCTTYGFAMRDIDPEMPEKVFSRVVFILCSEQRGFGKTEFFRKIGLSGAIEKSTGIVGTEIYAEAQGELPKDDRNVSINLITKMIYLFDDINNLLIKSEGTLRSIISQDYVTKRDLYKDSNKSLKKRATFAGTTNYRELLRNESENRYMLFTVEEKMDFKLLNSIDIFQLWSQIRQEIISNKKEAFFSHQDYDSIIKMSKEYIYHSELEDMLNNMFVYNENGCVGFSEVMKSLKEEYSISASMNNVGAKLKLLAPEGVNIKYKKNGKRFYKLEWRNKIEDEDNQDLPF